MSRRAKIACTLGPASSSPERLAALVAAGIDVAQPALSWGVETFIVPPTRPTDPMVRQVEEALLEIGRCDKADKGMIVAGSPPGTRGRTNALRVHLIGDAAALGAGLG